MINNSVLIKKLSTHFTDGTDLMQVHTCEREVHKHKHLQALSSMQENLT